MGKSYDLGPRIGIEGEDEFRKGILNTQSVVTTLGLEMEAVGKQFDKNDKSVEKLTGSNKILNKQIEAQKEVLSSLNKGLDYAKENYGENDKRTQQWKQSVLRAEMKLRDLEDAVEDNNDALIDGAKNAGKFKNKTDEVGDSAEKAGGKVRSFLKSFAGGAFKTAAKTIAGIGAAATAAVASLFRLSESTKEYRLDLSKLEQSSKSANQNYDVMKGHVSGLTALTGEMDSSIEAVANLMATGFDEQGISKAVDALSGAVIKFPDTLKIEGLADGLQETLATGKAIGPFAELIERLGGDLDEFNAQMANATTEAEKQQVALDYLANSGLADVNAEYKQANKDMLAAAEAQQKLDDALAGMATVVEPMITSVKSGAADVLSSIIGMATGAEGSTEDFKSSIDSLVSGVIGQIQNMIPGISTAAQTLIPTLINGIVQALPQLIQTAVILLDTLIKGIIENLPLIIDAALMLTMMLVSSLLDNLPLLFEGATQIIIALALGIAEALPELIPTVVNTVLTIVQGLLDNLPLLIDAAIQLVVGIAQGIINALPLLLAQAPTLIRTLIQGLVAAMPMLVDAAISIIKGLVDFLTNGENIAMLVTSSLEVIMAIAGGLIQAIPELIFAMPEIIASIIDAFMETDWLQLGKDILAGVGEGIKDAAGNLAEAAKNAATAALDGVKNLLDINSPSGVMRDEVGLMMGYGIAEGLIDSGNEIERALGEVTQKVQVDTDYYGNSNGIYDYSYDYSQRVEQNINVGDGMNAIEWERRMNAMAIQQMEAMVRNS